MAPCLLMAEDGINLRCAIVEVVINHTGISGVKADSNGGDGGRCLLSALTMRRRLSEPVDAAALSMRNVMKSVPFI